MTKSKGLVKGQAKKSKSEPRRTTLRRKPAISAGDHSVVIGGNVKDSSIQILNQPKIPVPIPRMAPPFPQLFLGREKILNTFTKEMFDERQSQSMKVMALVGMGGIGKTTLAVALANQSGIESRFPDGTVWISLGPKPDIMNLFLELGMQFGKDFTNYPSPEARSRALTTLLNNKQIFIVLDDVWSIEDAKLFLIGNAGCVVLLTTRNEDIARSLALKNIFQVDFMTNEESLELLKNLVPNPSILNLKNLRDIFSILGGLPLALTLAGKIISDEMAATNSISNILTELKEKEKVLSMALEQQSQSLDAVLGVSYEHLPDEVSRRIFCSLGVFGGRPNTFSLEAAAAICGIDGRPLQKAMVVLVNRGLVNVIGNGRYWLHSILAEYASNLLSGEEISRLCRKHAEYFLGIARQYREDNIQDWHRFDMDWRNTSLSLDWLSSNPLDDLDELTSSFVGALSSVIQIRRPLDGLKWLKAAERSSHKAGNALLEANLALTQGALNLDRGEFDLAINDFERSEKLFESLGRMGGLNYARGNLGLVQHRRGNYQQAVKIYRQVIDSCESQQDKIGAAIGYLNLGDVYYYLENYSDALANLEESISLFHEDAVNDFLVRALALKSKVLLKNNELIQAQESCGEAYRIAEQLASPGLLGIACQQMAEIQAFSDGIDAAKSYFQKAIELLSESNFLDELAEACIAYGKFLLAIGETVSSKQYVLEAAGILEYMGARPRIQEVDEMLEQLQDI